MLVKDNDLANTIFGQQVVFGLAPLYDMWITGAQVNPDEFAYAVMGYADNTFKFHGVTKPWSKLAMEFMETKDDEKSIEKQFPNLIGDTKIVYIDKHQYLCGRFDKYSFFIHGVEVAAFVTNANGTIKYSGYGKVEILKNMNLSNLFIIGEESEVEVAKENRV